MILSVTDREYRIVMDALDLYASTHRSLSTEQEIPQEERTKHLTLSFSCRKIEKRLKGRTNGD